MNTEKAIKIRFKTPCNIEFDGDIINHWSGNVIISREILGKHPFDAEYLKTHSLTGFSFCKDCATCTLDRTLEDNIVGHLNGLTFYDVKEQYCKARIIDSPYPLLCPITGHSLHCLAMDDDEKVHPIYKDLEGNLRTELVWCDYSQSLGLRFKYKEVEQIVDQTIYYRDSYISQISNNSNESFYKMLNNMLETTKDNPKIQDTVKFLINMFNDLEGL